MGLTRCKTYAFDLDEPLRRAPFPWPLLSGDSLAHRLAVTLTQGGQAVNTDGAQVAGYFIRPDGETVLVTGASAAGEVSVLLDASCYCVPGAFSFVLRVTLGGVRQTVLWLEGSVSASSTDVLVDPASVVPSLDDLLLQVARIESAADAAEHAAALVDGLTVSAQQQAEISAALSTQSGHYHIAFGIPRGTDGVVGSLGSTLWSVAVSSAGDLILYYPDGASAPPLTLSADGDLIYTTD